MTIPPPPPQIVSPKKILVHDAPAHTHTKILPIYNILILFKLKPNMEYELKIVNIALSIDTLLWTKHSLYF